jgi:hypothetical protein
MMVRMQMWLAARQEGVQKRAYVRMLRTPSRRRAGERLGHTTQRYQQHVKVHGRPCRPLRSPCSKAGAASRHASCAASCRFVSIHASHASAQGAFHRCVSALFTTNNGSGAAFRRGRHRRRRVGSATHRRAWAGRRGGATRRRGVDGDSPDAGEQDRYPPCRCIVGWNPSAQGPPLGSIAPIAAALDAFRTIWWCTVPQAHSATNPQPLTIVGGSRNQSGEASQRGCSATSATDLRELDALHGVPAPLGRGVSYRVGHAAWGQRGVRVPGARRHRSNG